MLPRANIAIVLSLALHLAWMLELPSKFFPTQQSANKINIKLLEQPKIKSQMVMAHQKPTRQPINESRESWENHRAEKPMNPKELSKQNAESPLSAENLKAEFSQSEVTKQPPSDQASIIDASESFANIQDNRDRKKRIVVKGTTARNSYEKLLYQTATALSNNPANHPENNEIGTGDRVDLDTTEYRYMGYFSSMRKAIEMVWIYPAEAARRGIQGTVTLEFRIEKNGSAKNIKILRSSGEKSLDRAILEAISLAQPFSPLPNGLGKEQLIVTGNFNYVLTGYAISH